MKTPIYHNPQNVPLDLVDPENEGWRLMLVEEIDPKREGTHEIEKWGAIKWDSTGWAANSESFTYRTKWTLPAEYLVNEKGWIAFSDHKPTKEDLPIVALYTDAYGVKGNTFIDTIVTGNWSPSYFAWVSLPAIPKKEKTPEELDTEAFNEFAKNLDREKVFCHPERDAWFAALKYARGEK